jgi:hypothetical protein
MLRLLIVAFGCACLPFCVGAQQNAGHVKITIAVYDSIHERSAAGFSISLIAGSRIVLDDTADARGEVQASVEPGTYRLVVFHSFLDALDLGLEREITVTDAPQQRIEIAVPSRRTVTERACGPTVDTIDLGGVIFGKVQLGSGVLEGAKVAAEWVPSGKLNEPTPKSEVTRIRSETDATGRFRICGIPAGTAVMLSASHTSFAKTVGIVTSANEPVLGLTIRLSSDSTQPGLEFTSRSEQKVPADDRKTIRGRVVAGDGTVVADASIQLINGSRQVSSNASGDFTLPGVNTGAVLIVRRPGFDPTEVHFSLGGVELAAQRGVVVMIYDKTRRLQSVEVSTEAPPPETALDTALRNIGYTTRQKYYPGQFITAEQIARMIPTIFSDIFATSPVVRRRTDGRIEGIARKTGGGPSCLTIFVDDAERRFTDDLDGLIHHVGRIEAYKPINVPPQYRRTQGGEECTVVLVWTKSRLGIQK